MDLEPLEHSVTIVGIKQEIACYLNNSNYLPFKEKDCVVTMAHLKDIFLSCDR